MEPVGHLNRTMLEMARPAHSHKEVPKGFWADSEVTANYLQNQLTGRTLPPKKNTNQTVAQGKARCKSRSSIRLVLLVSHEIV